MVRAPNKARVEEPGCEQGPHSGPRAGRASRRKGGLCWYLMGEGGLSTWWWECSRIQEKEAMLKAWCQEQIKRPLPPRSASERRSPALWRRESGQALGTD